MSFRHRKFNVSHSLSGEVMQSIIVRDNGDDTLSYASVDAVSSNFPMPEPSDYTLDKLLNSGLPLDFVNPTLIGNSDVLNSIPSDIDTSVNNSSNNDN